MFSAIVKIVCYFSDRNIICAKSPSIYQSTGDLSCTIFGKFVFFFSITYRRTELLLKEDIVVFNIPLARTFTVLIDRSATESRLSNFRN